MKTKIAIVCASLFLTLLTVACGRAASARTSVQSTAAHAPNRASVNTLTLATLPPLAADINAERNTLAQATTMPLATETPTTEPKEPVSTPIASPTSDVPQTYIAFDANFLARPCPLFTGDDEIRAYACDFGEYYMLHKQATTRYSYFDKQFVDGVIEATGYFNKGSGKYEYGIVFRANTDGTAYYVFTVTNDGRYNVSLYQNEKYTDLIPYTSSSIVTIGDDEWNTFKVVMRGNRFDFYLNDQFLDTVRDDALKSGVVGLFFYNDTPDTEVAFDQLTISTFEPPVSETPSPDQTSTAPNASPTPGEPETFVAFDADFLSDPCPLFEGDNDVREYGCDLGEYYMLHKQATTRYAFNDASFVDGIVQAAGYFNKGSGKYEYGIVFRASTDGTAYYVFTVTDDGKYNAAIYQNEKYTDLIPYTSSSIVNTGEGERNTFKVIMRGNRFDFYLNDQFLDTVRDDALESGVVGLFFYNDTPDTEVAFDQLTISTFEPPVSETPSPDQTSTAPNASPTPDVPETFVAFDADFMGEPCPLFEGDNDVRAYGCDFGEYYMLHKQATTRYSYYDVDYADAVIEANGYFHEGSGKYEYGIVFRASADGTAYYILVVTEDGHYNVARYQDKKYTDLIPYTSSPIVATGVDNGNTLKVVMRGDRFDFYLNDQFLDTVTDDALASGTAGLFFYNDTANTEVRFDQFTISTFSPPPTTTPEPTSPSGTATPTAPSVAPTAAVRPGIYVTGLRFAPGAPKRGQPMTFYATFLNTTGRDQNYKWLVEIWETNTNKKNPYGQADHLEQLIPTGANERATGDSFKVAGGGPCISFRAHVVFVDDQGRRVPFLRTNGVELWVPFQVCP
ncbi:MAG: hypothetical protein IT331_00360 [Anaerolineae bacterium]|nr:hypothetical protein [Anaerolineae bacterium]